MAEHYNVLFLCTGNSARSIMAEALLNQKGDPTFHGFSAGSHATGRVHPEALRQLDLAHVTTRNLRSKNWDEFAEAGAPKMDFIITVCDNAAHETCPVWPGHPVSAHWGVRDPASVAGTQEEITQAFRDAFEILERRIKALLALPLGKLDRAAMQKEMERIGRLG